MSRKSISKGMRVWVQSESGGFVLIYPIKPPQRPQLKEDFPVLVCRKKMKQLLKDTGAYLPRSGSKTLLEIELTARVVGEPRKSPSEAFTAGNEYTMKCTVHKPKRT